jgi:DNA-binding MarR family transcriptional regulator
MPTREHHIRQMVAALMATVSSTARTSKKGNAATLSLLHILAAAPTVRPSDIATALDVHQSTITRQMQSLEKDGYITVTGNSGDRRSCVLALTDAGKKHMQEFEAFGLSRFESFVADWTIEEIQTLAHLLAKFEASKTTAARREKEPQEPTWRQRT